MVQLVKER